MRCKSWLILVKNTFAVNCVWCNYFAKKMPHSLCCKSKYLALNLAYKWKNKTYCTVNCIVLNMFFSRMFRVKLFIFNHNLLYCGKIWMWILLFWNSNTFESIIAEESLYKSVTNTMHRCIRKNNASRFCNVQLLP